MQEDALWRHAPEPHSGLRVCVVLPVRNEAAGLAATLAALAGQQTLAGAPLDRSHYELLLLANNCDDASTRIASDFASANPGLALHIEDITLPPADAHIGHVRKLLMDHACQRLLRAGAPRGIVASTDGDTVVGAQWLAATQQEFASPIDAVGGRIVLDPLTPIDAHTLRWQRCDTAHRLAQSRLEDLLDPDPADPWPRHHQHFCASLAVRRNAYLQVGGVPKLRFLEDEALVAALRRADLQVRHSPQVRVQTSARRDGRAEVGLSWQLRQWGERQGDAAPMLVEDADAFAAVVQARRRLREGWRSGRRQAMARATAAVSTCFDVTADEVGARARSTATFGALWADLQTVGRRAPLLQRVPVREAIARLQVLIALRGGHCGARSSGTRSKTSSR